MTLPHERTRSVVSAREFLIELTKDKSLPNEIRDQAKGLLRHYPYDYQVYTAGKMEENPSWVSVFGPVFSSTCEWDDPNRDIHDMAYSSDKLEKVFAYQVEQEGYASRPFEVFRDALEYALKIKADREIAVYLKGGRRALLPKSLWLIKSKDRDISKAVNSHPHIPLSEQASSSTTCLNDLVCIAVREWLVEEITRMDHALYRKLEELSQAQEKRAEVDEEPDILDVDLDGQGAVAKIWQEVLELFDGDESLAIDFLFRKNFSLGERPVDVLLHDSKAVLELVVRIQYGVPS